MVIKTRACYIIWYLSDIQLARPDCHACLPACLSAYSPYRLHYELYKLWVDDGGCRGLKPSTDSIKSFYELVNFLFISYFSGASPNKPCIFPFTFNGKLYRTCTWVMAHHTDQKVLLEKLKIIFLFSTAALVLHSGERWRTSQSGTGQVGQLWLGLSRSSRS